MLECLEEASERLVREYQSKRPSGASSNPTYHGDTRPEVNTADAAHEKVVENLCTERTTTSDNDDFDYVPSSRSSSVAAPCDPSKAKGHRAANGPSPQELSDDAKARSDTIGSGKSKRARSTSDASDCVTVMRARDSKVSRTCDGMSLISTQSASQLT